MGTERRQPDRCGAVLYEMACGVGQCRSLHPRAVHTGENQQCENSVSWEIEKT